MICQRCTKEKDGIHTCTPSEFVRELEEQVAALTNRAKNAENETAIYKEENETLREQVAAAQAVIAEVHAWVVCAGITTPEDMAQNFDRIVEITTPSDTTALQERLAEERERCAKVCDHEHNRDDLTGDYRYGAGICAAAIRSMK